MAEVAQFLACSFIVNAPGYPDNIESVFQLFAEGSFVQIKKKIVKVLHMMFSLGLFYFI